MSNIVWETRFNFDQVQSYREGKVIVEGSKKITGAIAISIIWLIGAISDRLWFIFDRSVPAWDPAYYLTGSLIYRRAFQDPQWFSGQWWDYIWNLSAKIPPLVYILTIPFQNIFAPSPDTANLVHLLFSAILLGSVYCIGCQLFNRQVALWAAGLCLLLPALYLYRFEYLLDYPVTASVAFSFLLLTMWRKCEQPRYQWLWAIAVGISVGLAFLVKQTTALFLFVPLLWVTVGTLKRRDWGRFFQMAIAGLLSVLVFGPWLSNTWLLMITSVQRATIYAARAEGDPPLTDPEAWTYYLSLLPDHVSWPLLLVPIVGFLLYLIRWRSLPPDTPKSGFAWLAVFLVGGYLLCSLNPNKDFRYNFALLPMLSIVLAWGLTLWPKWWGVRVRWGTMALAVLLMILTLWPVGGVPGQQFRSLLSPGNTRHAEIGVNWPHPEIISTILAAEPYLQNTIGVLPSTENINQHNIDYYGAIKDFQVYGRQVGIAYDEVSQDAGSLCWFITKTGDQGSVDRIKEAQTLMVTAIAQGPQFPVYRNWLLPDGNTLNLHRCTPSPVEVSPRADISEVVNLEAVIVPESAPPGVPIPITYIWSGPPQQLESGLVLLTWTALDDDNNTQWFHDRAIGSGRLELPEDTATGFEVVERMAMLPPPDATPGNYTLQATYLSRETGETLAIASPPITLTIDPNAAALPAPELDLITQLQQLALKLPQGIQGLEVIFNEIRRINQYDPVQDYTKQAQKTLAYRLNQEPDNLNLAYSLALASVLEQDVNGAIAALETVTKLDPNNPFAHAYLAFVHLYNFNARAAEIALQPALALNPEQPEFLVLRGVSALLQGRFLQAKQDLQALSLINN